MKIYDLNRPGSTFSGLEMVPAMKGSNDVSIPLFAARDLPTGDVVVMRRLYTADRGSTANSDPGVGNLRWNNVTPDSADTLFVDDEDTETNNGMVDKLVNEIEVGARIYIQGCADTESRDNWQVWDCAYYGVDETGYASVSVNLVDSNGVIADNDPIEVSVVNPTPNSGLAQDRRDTQFIYSAVGVFPLDYNSITSDFVYTAVNEDIDSWSITNFPTNEGGRMSLLFLQVSPPNDVTWPAEFNWGGETPPSMPTGDGDVLRVDLTWFGDGVFDATARVRD